MEPSFVPQAVDVLCCPRAHTYTCFGQVITRWLHRNPRAILDLKRVREIVHKTGKSWMNERKKIVIYIYIPILVYTLKTMYGTWDQKLGTPVVCKPNLLKFMDQGPKIQGKKKKKRTAYTTPMTIHWFLLPKTGAYRSASSSLYIPSSNSPVSHSEISS